MKLPDVPMRGVEGLPQLNPQEEANQALAPYQTAQKAIGAAYQSYEHYQLLEDQENALTEANRSSAINNVLKTLENPEVNLNALPAEAIKAYEASKPDTSLHGVMPDTGETYAPSHKVGQFVFDWANKELESSNNRLRSSRAATLYKESIGADIEASFEKANAGIRTSQIEALIVQTDALITNQSEQGNINTSLAAIKNGENSGIYDQEKAAKRRKEVFDHNADIYAENQQILQDEMLNAAYSGSPEEIAAIANEFLKEVKYAEQYGQELVPEDKLNEYMREFKTAGLTGELSGEASDIYDKGTFEESISYLEGLERDLNTNSGAKTEDGLTVKDKQKAIAAARTHIQQRHNALKAASNASSKAANASLDIVTFLTAFDDFGKVPTTGPANTAYNKIANQELGNIYRAERDQFNMIIEPHQKREVMLNFVGKYGNLPDYMVNKFDGAATLDSPQMLEVVRDFAQLRMTHPDIARQYTGVNSALMNQAANEIVLGGDKANSEVAMDKLKENFTNDPETFKARMQTVRASGDFEAKKLDKIVDEVVDDYDDWFSTEPETTDYMARMIKENYQYYRGLGADKDAAIESVKASMKMVGKTMTNSDYEDGNLMIMPPEQVYGDWVLPQFKEMIANQFPDFNPDGFKLVTDAMTMYGDSPSWAIMYRDPNNKGDTWRRIPSQNSEGAHETRFHPDYSQTEEAKKAEAEFLDNVETGKFAREQKQIINEAYTQALDKYESGGIAPKEYYVDSHRQYVAAKESIKALKSNPIFQETYTNPNSRSGRGSESRLNKDKWQTFEKTMLKALRGMYDADLDSRYTGKKEEAPVQEQVYVSKKGGGQQKVDI